MKRITVGEVRAAYRETGFLPIKKVFVKGTTRCCPEAVLSIIHEGGDPYLYAKHTYGELYASGFRNGYDGYKRYSKAARYLLGYIDGRRVARALGYKVPPLQKRSA